MDMLRLLDFAFGFFVQNGLKRRIKPRVVQLPVTGRCNSRCATCGVWREEQAARVDVSAADLKKVFQDPFFSKVRAVGMNGGEPSLHPDVGGLAESLLSLKRLKHIYVISNGIFTRKVLEMMETLKAKCTPRGVTVHLTISVDGVGERHDSIRGVPAFEKTMATLREVMADKRRYCDVLEAGVTLSAQNMPYVAEIASYMERLRVAAWYHPAVPNRRLHNFEDHSFSLLSDERSRMLATEYFFAQFKQGQQWKTRLRAFLTYRYLLHRGRYRLAGCNYLRSDVTVAENLDVYLCATASERVGNLKESSVRALRRSGAFGEAEKNVRAHCAQCVHYIIFPTLAGACLFIRALLKPSVWIKYKLLAIWLK
jgi:MoaA/NifB/PqqE/SkfB family radical SAM enzyme